MRGLLRERGFLCMLEFRGMLGFRGALLLRNSTTGGSKGITLTKTTRRSSRNLLSYRGLRRKQASRGFLNRCLHCRLGSLLRCFLGGALRNRGNLPRTQGGIHACGLGGVCAGQRLTVATPRILTAARTISQWRRLSGLRGSLLNGLLRRLRGNSHRNCRLRCGSTGRCGLDLLTGLRHLSVNGHLTAQELAHAGGQLGHKTLDRAQSRNVGAHVQGRAVHSGGANLHQLLRRTGNAHSVKDGTPITLNRRQRIVRVKLQRRGGGARRSCYSRSRGMRCRRGVTR